MMKILFQTLVLTRRSTPSARVPGICVRILILLWMHEDTPAGVSSADHGSDQKRDVEQVRRVVRRRVPGCIVATDGAAPLAVQYAGEFHAVKL